MNRKRKEFQQAQPEAVLYPPMKIPGKELGDLPDFTLDGMSKA